MHQEKWEVGTRNFEKIRKWRAMLNKKMTGEKFDIKNWDLQKHMAIDKNKNIYGWPFELIFKILY